MSLIRFLMTFTLVLLAIVLGREVGGRIHALWQKHRLARFEVDAARSMAYPLQSVNWLEFDIPRQTRALRVLTNAAVTGFADRPITRQQPREGWRYALDYQLLTRDGELLDDSRYHLRASVIQCRDSKTGGVQAISWFGRSDWIPTMTRTVQLPFGSTVDTPGRLRLRLASRDADVQEVVIRVYMRNDRTDYDESYAWSRLSPDAHAKLCRPLVYPPELLTALERQNLLRWNWTALAPVGREGRDYRRRWFYQSVSADEIPAADEPPDGLLCSAEQHVTFPLPIGAGKLQLVCERVEVLDGHPAVEVIVQRHPDQPGPSESRRWRLSQSKQVFELPVDGGLLEVHATDPIVCRGIWRDSSDSSNGSMRELDDSQRPLRAFLAPPNAPLNYSITSFRGRSTPFCLTLRHLRSDPSLTPERVVSRQGEPAPVEYCLLDAQGLVLRRGELMMRPDLSVYDRARGTSLEGAVSEPASFYFALDPQVRCVRVRAADESVAIVALTRPPELPRTWRLPEDSDTYQQFTSEDRTWFILQPDNVERRLGENLTVAILSQMRPPVRDPQVIAGMYLWEDFAPRGFWKGRHLLTRRESELPLRAEAISVTFCQLQPSRKYDVQLRSALDEPSVEPRLIYSAASKLPGPVRMWLDGQPWHTFRPRARRGEVVLPRLPVDATAKRHSLLIQADAGLQLFLSNVWAENTSLYTKRLVPQFENGRMRFTVTKRSSQPEGLILRPFFPQGWRERVQIQVRIADSPPRPEGPFDSWTLLSRKFDVRPQFDQPGLVLGLDSQRVDSGQRCFLRLADDLPAGDYTVEVQLEGHHPPVAYATLYRLLPGRHPRREAKLADSWFDPLILRSHGAPATHPAVITAPQAKLMP